MDVKNKFRGTLLGDIYRTGSRYCSRCGDHKRCSTIFNGGVAASGSMRSNSRGGGNGPVRIHEQEGKPKFEPHL